jgi:hypothetical protein
MANAGLCSVGGCGKAKRSKGFCGKHYARFHRYGDPNAGGQDRRNYGEPMAFILSCVENSSHECIFWPFSKTGNGYPKIRYKGELVLAHRLSLSLFHKIEIPNCEIECRHVICSNGHLGCINPLHLNSVPLTMEGSNNVSLWEAALATPSARQKHTANFRTISNSFKKRINLN